ncbi:chemotaxis protein CheW [Sporomusaceae bacterium FL31]|nr:chemotaxis protein CheW [Sporomusaceae bacterium FL31]GCE34463.1 chemotaxis protein CheW [Sporomusaceae bacterium]
MIEEQVVIFRIQEEEYAIPMDAIKGILTPCEIITTPDAPDYLEGIIRKDGQIIPVIRLSAKFGLVGHKPEVCHVILAQIGSQEIGIAADGIIENFCLSATCLDASTRGRSYLGSCIRGLGEIGNGNRVIILLDIAQVFSEAELATLRKLDHYLTIEC